MKFLRHVIRKKILSKLDHKIRVEYEILRLKKMVAIVNNFCNLTCFSCGALCDKPFDNVFRDKKRALNPDSLNLALNKILDVIPYTAITFTGGEPTLVPNILTELSFIAREHGLKTILLSNGHKINELVPSDFDYIILDNHAVNINDIWASLNHFKKYEYKNYFINKQFFHKDYAKARAERVTTWGQDCPNFMRLGIWRDLVYPCCGFPYIEGWDNDEEIYKALKIAGWGVDNPRLRHILRDWKSHLPDVVMYKCLYSCWKYREAYEWKRIT